jgi:hypothetical protein
LSLAAGGDELYLGTTRFGNGVIAAGEARLLVFDTESTEVTLDTVPVAGAGAISSLVKAPNGLVYGATNTGAWFTFDPTRRTITRLGGFPGAIRTMTTGPDGNLYAATSTAVYWIEPETNQITKLTDAHIEQNRILEFDNDGRLYWANGTRLMRITPPARTPPS